MNPLITPPSNTAPANEDLAEQARPGHGIPSQDPDPAAQIPLETQEAQREAQSVLMGGGVVAGAATGAAVGVMVAGGGDGRNHTRCRCRRTGRRCRWSHGEPGGFERRRRQPTGITTWSSEKMRRTRRTETAFRTLRRVC
jgi:hypothetical protein